MAYKEFQDLETTVRWGYNVCVNKNVYDPSDDTYLVLDFISKKQGLVKEKNVLDLGCGTGIIGLSALDHGAAHVTFIDVNPYATQSTLCTLFLNNKLIGNNDDYEVITCNLLSCVRKKSLYDLVIFNPPYLPVNCKGEYYEYSWCGDGLTPVTSFLGIVNDYLVEKGDVIFVLSSKSSVEGIVKQALNMGYELRVVGDESFFFEKIIVFLARKRIT